MEETPPRRPTAPEPSPGPRASWMRWTPWAATAWSLLYAALGGYWLLGGRGFPYVPGTSHELGGSLAAAAAPGVAWSAVVLLGLPSALLAAVMSRRPRRGRRLLLVAGTLVPGVLLLAMIDVSLLVALGYLPYAALSLVTGAPLGQTYLASLAWPFPHQVLCLVGGLLWGAATASYALSTARPDARTGGWTRPESAARWGSYAVAAALMVPVYYAATRIIWALGLPWGVTEEFLREGQESGLWTAGLFLAFAALGGAVLTLGLAQRWGEVFPHWFPGLAGREVPVALAVVPASTVSVLLVVAGVSMWTAGRRDTGVEEGVTLGGALPTLLMPVWGAALAAATLAYVLRRRGSDTAE